MEDESGEAPQSLTRARLAMSTFDALAAQVAIVDATGLILAVNASWSSFGAANTQGAPTWGVGRNYLEVCAQGEGAAGASQAAAGIREVLDGNTSEFVLEYPCGTTSDERWFLLRVTPLRESGATLAMVMHTDITQRRRTEHALRESEREQRRLAAALEADRARLVEAQALAEIGSWETDVATLEVTWSEQSHRIFETSPSSFGPTHLEFLHFVHPEDRAAVDEAFRQSTDKQGPFSIEHRLLMSDGRIKFVEERWSIVRDAQGKPLRALGTCQDITARHLAHQRLQKIQTALQIAGRLGQLGAWTVELPGPKLSFSDEARAIFELPAEVVPTIESLGDLCSPESYAVGCRALTECLTQGTPFDNELQVRTAQGRSRWVRSMGEAVYNADGVITGLQGAFQNITDRKESERELARVNRALRMLSRCNEALTRTENEPELLEDICRIAVEDGGYRMAWVGYARSDDSRTVAFQAHAGIEEGYLSQIDISWSDAHEKGEGPAGQVMRTGRNVVSEDLEQDPTFAPWLAPALERGYRSVVCLPLRDGPRTFGVLTLYAGEVRAANQEEIALLQQVADDLAFGVMQLHARLEKRQLEGAVVKVAAGVSATSKEAFFRELTAGMAEVLGASAAFVAEFGQGQDQMARTLAAVVRGREVDNFEYSIADSPCQQVWANGTCVRTQPSSKPFHTVSCLSDLPVRSYVGQRLSTSEGSPLGLLFVLFDEPPTRADFVASTLQIFAARAASELERKQVADRLQEQAALLDVVREPIVVTNLDHGISYWNKGAERTYGFSAEEALGRSVRDLLDVKTDVFEQVVSAVQTRGEWQGEMLERAKDGSSIAVEARSVLVLDPAGQPKSILYVKRDISERKRLERQFLRVQRLESIGTLAGGIAHDLNNVLSPIFFATDMLRLDERDAERLRDLEIIETCTRRGADMVKQVLSFARGVEGEHLPTHLGWLIRETQKVIVDTFPKNIALNISLGSGIAQVRADATQISQVLMNLAVNARDAMPDGGTLTIALENVALDEVYSGMNSEARTGNYTLVRVEDTGSGMSAEVLERAFEPFFTTKDIGKGTGLGLSTSHAIVKSHGGFIHISSELGKGTKFRIYLPALGEDSTSPRVSSAEPDLPTGHGELVLVIDDEAPIRAMVRRCLERFGYRVLVAANGAEAIALYVQRKSEVAVVLTDMAMPVMDGPATIVALRSLNPAIRIIGSSGLETDARLTKAHNAGVEHFVSKPYTAEHLLSTIKRALSN